LFLRDSDGSLNAETVFGALSIKSSRTLRDRLDFWIEGFRRDNWFHGWPSVQDSKNCFVFKWNEQNIDQRLYGFLFHPMKITRPEFQVCVLHTHDQKSSWETNPEHLRLSVKLRDDPSVKKAIADIFPDTRRS
jgi:hypothetical protein